MVAATLAMDGGQLSRLLILRDELRKDGWGNGAVGTENRQLLGDALKLAHITWPLIVHQHLLGVLVEHHAVHLVLLGHLQGKQAEQQDDILATIAQGRHLYLHLIKAIIEVFAETPLADGLTNIDISSSHNTYIGLTNLGGSHWDILTILEHTQQTGLSG